MRAKIAGLAGGKRERLPAQAHFRRSQQGKMQHRNRAGYEELLVTLLRRSIIIVGVND